MRIPKNAMDWNGSFAKTQHDAIELDLGKGNQPIFDRTQFHEA